MIKVQAIKHLHNRTPPRAAISTHLTSGYTLLCKLAPEGQAPTCLTFQAGPEPTVPLFLLIEDGVSHPAGPKGIDQPVPASPPTASPLRSSLDAPRRFPDPFAHSRAMPTTGTSLEEGDWEKQWLPARLAAVPTSGSARLSSGWRSAGRRLCWLRPPPRPPRPPPAAGWAREGLRLRCRRTGRSAPGPFRQASFRESRKQV